MPHIAIKLAPGRSQAQKAAIAEAVAKAVVATAGCADETVSVGIEDVAPDAWTATVYAPEIAGKWETLYKKPGYAPR